MSDGTAIQWAETEHLPDPNAIVLVYGGRCQQCGLTRPGDGVQDAPEIRERVRANWRDAGLAHLVQDTYPMRFPAWLVRQGFRCPACEAPDMLLDLGTVENLRVREYPEVGR